MYETNVCKNQGNRCRKASGFGAALNVSCSYATARRYHWEFIITVAKQYGLLDKNEPLEPKKYDKTVV